MNLPLIVFTKITAFPVGKILFKWKFHFINKQAQGTKIPKGAIVVSNHKALLDVALYFEAFFRAKLRFLVAEVIYENSPVLNFLLNGIGCIKINRRDFDFSFIQESVDVLKKGGNICVFPEGQLPRNGKMSRFTQSYVMIALQADAEIVPVFTDGCYGIKKQANIMVGERIRLRDYCSSEFPSKDEIQECNRIVAAKIVELGKELERRKGNPDADMGADHVFDITSEVGGD